MLMFVAWFSLSNHCVLGASRPNADPVEKGCPMHMQSSDNAPAKHKGSDLPCCKTVRAVMSAKINVASNTVDFVLTKYFLTDTQPDISERSPLVLSLDTGPPDALSFSESVLQRSILAHAPPFPA